MENLISGRTYRIETGVPIEKSFKTANNDRPDGLADGKTASLDYSDGAWCRFYRGLSRSVTVDLDGEKSIDGFEITFLQNKSAGIYTPERVELYVSENGDDFMLAYTVESLVSPSSSEVTYSPFRLTDAAKYRARFVKLTFGTDVFAFAWGFCVSGGECDGSELPFVPENAKNDCRAMLPKADGFSSTVIIYNGYWDSTMNYSESYVRSTAEMLLPYVGYIGGDGEVYDTMFDSVVFLLLQSRSPSGGKTVFFSNGDGNATVKSDFDYFADNLFANGVNMDALDEAFGIVKKQLNLSDDRKLNVSLQLPYVYKTDLPFGDINGDGTDEKAETPDERLAIYEYYVDMISARFASRDYKNITLVAFYQGCEGVPVAMSDDEYGLFRLVNEMLHKKGFRATWIPCFLGTGFDSWKELGFDYAYLQPNYMFHDWQPDSLADGKLLILVINDGNGVAREAQIHRAVGLGRGTDELSCRNVVCRLNNGDVRNGAQNAQILYRLMACAVICRGNAAVRACDLDIEIGVAHLLSDHFAHSQRAEHRIGHDKRDLACGGKAGRERGAVLLGNADIDVLLGQSLHKLCSLAGLADINVNHIDILIFLADFNDLVAEAVASSYHFTFFHEDIIIYI